MTPPHAHLLAGRLLGIPTSEIVSVDSSPAGDVIKTTDGQAYLNVPADNPDGDGATGLMFLAAPHEGYNGPMTVYTLPKDDDEPAVADTSNEPPTPPTPATPPPSPPAGRPNTTTGEPDRAALLARAGELGLTVTNRTATVKLQALIAEAEATK